MNKTVGDIIDYNQINDNLQLAGSIVFLYPVLYDLGETDFHTTNTLCTEVDCQQEGPCIEYNLVRNVLHLRSNMHYLMILFDTFLHIWR